MHRPSVWSLAVVLAACDARISDAPGDLAGPGDAAINVDAAATPPDALVLGRWSTPTAIAPAATPTAVEDDSTLSSNALELIFAIDSSTNGKDLYYTSRPSPTGAWETAQKLAFNNAT